jgi:hypothetical protein
VTSARAPHSGAAAGRPATRNIPTTPAAAGTSVSGFGGVHLASQSLLPTNPLHVPPPASAASPPPPLRSPTGSRLSPRRCVRAGDAVGVPPHPSTFVCVFPPFSEVLWRHAAPARCIAPAWCLLLRSSSATLFLVRCRVALCSPGFLICTFFLVVVCPLCTTGDPGVGGGECGPNGEMQLFSPRNLAFFWVDAHLSPEGHIWGPPPPIKLCLPSPLYLCA